MPSKNSYITVTDQFCGAGGSSQGVRKVSQKMNGGLEVRLAMNHWKLAIETHETNFPDTLHDCADISASDPRRYPSTDILITSPECTNHTVANGKKRAKAQMDLFNSGKMDAAAERSRATMWDVPRFAEYHNYNIIIVENVVDARSWMLWEPWLIAMHTLGYAHKCVYMNSMHCHPTPQSRDRMYIVFWKKGNKAPNLDFTPIAWCNKCGKDTPSIQSWKNPQKPFGKYKTQYIYCCPSCSSKVEPYYYASFNCIDWSNLGNRIGDRKKPLSENTVKRIEYGLNKYCRNPFVVNNQQSTGIGHRVKGIGETLPSIPTMPHLDMVSPFIFKGEHTMQDGYVRSVTEPVDTQTTRQTMGVVTPFIIELNRTGKARSSFDPLSTILTSGSHHALLVENKGQSKSKPATDPVACLTTKPHIGILSDEKLKAFISYYYGTDQASHITDPIGTASCKERHQLITYENPSIEDCYYRMLKPPEIQAAMAFEDSYIVLGSGKDKVKQLGNAVTPPAMEWLVERCIATFN